MLLRENRLRGDIYPVRDPSIAVEHGRYFVYSTDTQTPENQTGNILIRCSTDRINWSLCGRVFPELPAWIRIALPKVRRLWAPDISFFNGEYHLYYCASSLGSQNSVIGFATNATLDPVNPRFHWTDRGLILASRSGDDFNAIDPNIFVTEHGTVRLTYGSFWSGIKQKAIDPSTGRFSSVDTVRLDLAKASPGSGEVIEGPSLLRHGAYYYLFLSKGLCCEGTVERNNYQQFVGRARSPAGPFIDASGGKLLEGGGTLLIEGDKEWAAPGGGSAYTDPASGMDLLVFHALLRSNGRPSMWIKTIDWRDGWPVLRN